MKIPSKLLQETALKTETTIDIVEEVMSHQWRITLKGLSTSSSVEVSGLAKFKLRLYKVRNKIELLTRFLNFHNRKLLTEEDPAKRLTIQKKAEQAERDINFLKLKLQDGTPEG